MPVLPLVLLEPLNRESGSMLEWQDACRARSKSVVAEYVRALGIKKVYLWEDSSANISSIESLRSDELEITSTLVSEGILRKLIQRIIREAQVF